MARIVKPPKARLITAVVHSSIDACAHALDLLEKQFGRIICETTDLPLHHPEIYREEMGDRLAKRFFAFDRLVERDQLPSIKATVHKLEKQLGDQVNEYTFRTVNIDPGLLTSDNLVMAAHREFNHRVYLANGVFAELTLVWSRGRFVRLPWTDEDYCCGEAEEFFGRVRESLETEATRPALLA